MNFTTTENSLNIFFYDPLGTDCEVKDKQVQEVLQAASTCLQNIYMTEVKITQNLFKCISTKRWSNLQILSLTNVGLGNLGCKYLSLGQNWCIKLKQLILNNNHIESVGVFHLSKIKLQMLHELWLMGNRLGSEAIRSLTKCKCLNLKTLYLDRNQLTTFELINLYILQCAELETCYIFENHIIKSEDYLWKLALKKFGQIDQFYTY